MIENLMNFLWHQKIVIDRLEKMAGPKVHYLLKPYLQNFTLVTGYKKEVNDAIITHIQDVLNVDFQASSADMDRAVKQFVKNSGHVDKAVLLLDRETIKNLIKKDSNLNFLTTTTRKPNTVTAPTRKSVTVIAAIRKPSTKTTQRSRLNTTNAPVYPVDKFSTLRNKLNHWHRNQQETTEKIIDFLQSQNVNTTLIQNMEKSKLDFDYQFKLIQNSFLNEKMVEYVAQKYPASQKKVLKTLKVNEIESKFDMYSAFNLTRLHRIIETEILKCFDPNCAKNIRQKIENKADVKNETKSFLTSNNCVTMEICAKNSVINDDFLKKELKTYIESFEKSTNENRFEGYKNIKDDIDESIYDVIESLLKNHNVENHQCVAEFIKRLNLIDEKYNEALLFDEDKLWIEVENYVQSYKNLYV